MYKWLFVLPALLLGCRDSRKYSMAAVATYDSIAYFYNVTPYTKDSSILSIKTMNRATFEYAYVPNTFNTVWEEKKNKLEVNYWVNPSLEEKVMNREGQRLRPMASFELESKIRNDFNQKTIISFTSVPMIVTPIYPVPKDSVVGHRAISLTTTVGLRKVSTHTSKDTADDYITAARLLGLHMDMQLEIRRLKDDQAAIMLRLINKDSNYLLCMINELLPSYDSIHNQLLIRSVPVDMWGYESYSRTAFEPGDTIIYRRKIPDRIDVNTLIKVDCSFFRVVDGDISKTPDRKDIHDMSLMFWNKFE